MRRTWLLQHYSLAVWLTIGIDLKRRKPARLEALIRLLYTTVTGQVLALALSLFLLCGGRNWPDSILIGWLVLVTAGLLLGVLPRLTAQLKQEDIPGLFRQLTIGQRRQQVAVGLVVFWAAFGSIFVVAAWLS